MKSGRQSAGARGGARRTVLLALAGVALLAVLVAAVLTATGDDQRRPTADERTTTAPAAPTASAGPSGSPATPPPTGATANVEALPPALPPVGFEEDVTVADVTVALTAIEAIEGEATGPGNVAGPAVRVTVRLTNATGEVHSLDGVSVTLAYGPGGTPASPLEDRSRRPFAGSLASGDSVEGVYVFSVPRDGMDSVVVEVGHGPGVPRAVFAGPVA